MHKELSPKRKSKQAPLPVVISRACCYQTAASVCLYSEAGLRKVLARERLAMLVEDYNWQAGPSHSVKCHAEMTHAGTNTAKNTCTRSRKRHTIDAPSMHTIDCIFVCCFASADFNR